MAYELEIICVGNELLIGKTVNTNAQWLGRRATAAGFTVKRITVVGDEVGEIAAAVAEALKRKPMFIITTGGLGPTFDDKTLEGIAAAVNQRLRVNRKALSMVKQKYEAYAKAGRIGEIELTPARVKMAKIPDKAKPLPNPVGTAPAVLLKVEGTVLIALPGVPSEMQAIFDDSVLPMLKRKAGKLAFYEESIYADGIMESTLAPLIDETMHDNPWVYIKSHPKGEEQKPHMEIHFSTTAENPSTARENIEKAKVKLVELLRKAGAKIINA